MGGWRAGCSLSNRASSTTAFQSYRLGATWARGVQSLRCPERNLTIRLLSVEVTLEGRPRIVRLVRYAFQMTAMLILYVMMIMTIQSSPPITTIYIKTNRERLLISF